MKPITARNRVFSTKTAKSQFLSKIAWDLSARRSRTPELLERAERRHDYQRADAIKRAAPASWKHANLYGAYSFLDIGDGVDLQELVNLLEGVFMTEIDLSRF